MTKGAHEHCSEVFFVLAAELLQQPKAITSSVFGLNDLVVRQQAVKSSMSRHHVAVVVQFIPPAIMFFAVEPAPEESFGSVLHAEIAA